MSRDVQPETAPEKIEERLEWLLIHSLAGLLLWFIVGALLFSVNMAMWLLGLAQPPWEIIAGVLGL